MKVFHSIRWRIQFWHGLLLILVLAGFGSTAYQLQRTNQLTRTDHELHQRIGAVMQLAFPPPDKGRPDWQRPRGGPFAPATALANPPGKDRPERFEPPGPEGPNPEPPEPPEGQRPRLTLANLAQFEDQQGRGFYCMVWPAHEQPAFFSESAPKDTLRPSWQPGPPGFRFRGTLRECYQFTPAGDCILVGRDLRSDLASLRGFAELLVATGGAILFLGLAGGWWISTRALGPVAAISSAAAKIASGDLAQRIQTTDTSSELGQLACDLNHAFAQLQASFNLQAQFTADASHELRTPVSVVLTQTQTALARERSAEEYRESLSACQRAAKRMRSLIESLLVMARLDAADASPAPGNCDLRVIATESVDLLRPVAAEKQVELEMELEEAQCPGDPGQLGQVLSNLLSNAIFYNRPGGKARVKIWAEADGAVICVNDTGLGIPAEDLPHIFERFYRVDKARSSGHSGLGLAIIQAIVKRHRGTIEVSSTPGQGSEFRVRLPL